MGDNVHAARIRAAYAAAEELVDAELGPAYAADRRWLQTMDKFYTGNADEDRTRNGVLLMALAEFAARAVERAATAEAHVADAAEPVAA